MALKFEDLRVLEAAEKVADGIWGQAVQWDPFVRETIGQQLTRAADSIGANIAEAFGRFHYGDKLRFLYYARGSLFETKYWLNRILVRGLMPSDQVQDYTSQLTNLARQLNAFATTLKSQRVDNQSQSKRVSESISEFMDAKPNSAPAPLITENELEWLNTFANT